METARFFRQATQMTFRHPYIWLLVLLATVGDLWAALSFDPTTTDLPFSIVWFALLTFIAECGLIYAYAQFSQGKKSDFVDSFMSALAAIFPLLGAKGILLIIIAVFALVCMLLSSLMMQNVVATAILAAFTLPLLLFFQGLTFFTLCGILLHHHGLGEALPRGWQIFRGNLRRITLLVLPFIIIDLISLASMAATQVVTYRSTFIYEVTLEMADVNERIGTGGPIESGEYFSLGRPFSGFLATVLKVRGADLWSLPLFAIYNKTAGSIIVAMGALLLPLRVSVLSSLYMECAEPTSYERSVLMDIRESRTPREG
jgi:hypothetical protein